MTDNDPEIAAAMATDVTAPDAPVDDDDREADAAVDEGDPGHDPAADGEDY